MIRNAQRMPFRTIQHDADVAVVGGGMAGLCAAVAAAWRGAPESRLYVFTLA